MFSHFYLMQKHLFHLIWVIWARWKKNDIKNVLYRALRKNRWEDKPWVFAGILWHKKLPDLHVLLKLYFYHKQLSYWNLIYPNSIKVNTLNNSAACHKLWQARPLCTTYSKVVHKGRLLHALGCSSPTPSAQSFLLPCGKEKIQCTSQKDRHQTIWY